MRVSLPLLSIQPARAPILRYGVAVLSTTLALIPALLLPNITESRLAVFAVAVMVSAWYGGWKPGLGCHLIRADRERLFLLFLRTDAGAISFNHDAAVAVRCAGGSYLLVECGVASSTGKLATLRDEFPFSGDQRSLWHMPLRFRWPTVGCESRTAG